MTTTPPPAPARTVTPYSISDLHDLNIVLDIFRGLEHRISVVETIVKFHSEKIDQLTQWMMASPNLEEDVKRNTKDLNEVGNRHDKDIHELAMRLEKGLNDLGRRLGQEITNLKDGDIGRLKGLEHTVKSVGTFLVALAAGGGFVYIVQHFWPR